MSNIRQIIPYKAALGSERQRLLGILVAVITLALTYAAHAHGRPITSALVSVFGVMAVGALLGARAGIFAGIAASLTFNIVFTDPAWTFTYSTADDLVPMFALTLSAVGSGVLAGRLRDRAVAAETATRRVAELLRLSERLQPALTLTEIEETVQSFLASGRPARLFVEASSELQSPTNSSTGRIAAEECWLSHLPWLRCGAATGYLLKSGEKRIGVLVVDHSVDRRPDEIQVFLPLITLAMQRCQLAQQVAKADLVRRSEQFKTALLSSVSHDLRTPLAAISASASSLAELRQKLDDQTTTDLLMTIQEQCERLDRFTRNLLNLGRIEAGIDASAMPPIDALEVLGGTLARVRRSNGSHVIHRQFQVASAFVRADEVLLEQLFLNVLENAVTHTPVGTSVKVNAKAHGDELIVEVEDDGSGIPKADRSRIFDRFYQVTADGKQSSGSGLGLSIARGFTELFGGSIEAAVASAPMRGARIIVTLPLTNVDR